MNNSFTENELPPQGYAEALKDCTVLATNLLNQTITGTVIRCCWDCSSWVGRCLKGRIWVIARDEACNLFSPKGKGDNGV